jgi:hypothetical protein
VVADICWMLQIRTFQVEDAAAADSLHSLLELSCAWSGTASRASL